MITSTTSTPFRALLPDDEADDRLRQAVHPDDWTNPQPGRATISWSWALAQAGL